MGIEKVSVMMCVCVSIPPTVEVESSTTLSLTLGLQPVSDTAMARPVRARQAVRIHFFIMLLSTAHRH